MSLPPHVALSRSTPVRTRNSTHWRNLNHGVVSEFLKFLISLGPFTEAEGHRADAILRP